MALKGANWTFTGLWGWRVSELADFYESVAKHQHVHRLGYVDERDLAILYNGARALVFPTLYEGFGLPAIEMLVLSNHPMDDSHKRVGLLLAEEYAAEIV